MVDAMDPIREADLRYYSDLSGGERLRMALDMMQDGFEMQRANLRRRHPGASEADIEALLWAWMLRD